MKLTNIRNGRKGLVLAKRCKECKKIIAQNNGSGYCYTHHRLKPNEKTNQKITD